MHISIEGRADFGPLFPRDLIEGGATVMASSAADTIFDRVKTQLKARIGAEVFSSWFARMKLAESSKGIVRLSVPTAFLRAWINSHYLDLLAELWKQEDPDLLKVEIVVRTTTKQGRGAPEHEQLAARKAMPARRPALAAGTLSPARSERPPRPREW